MRKCVCLVVMAIAVLSARQLPNSISALRQALGGDDAVRAVARLHITATVNKGEWNEGSLEAFAILPGRFVQEIDTKVYPGAQPPRLGHPQSHCAIPRVFHGIAHGRRA